MPLLGRTVEAVVVDWDAVGAAGRRPSVPALRRRVERLTAAAVEVALVSAGGADRLDRRLVAPVTGPGRLLLLLDGGAELCAVGPDGPRRLAHGAASGRLRLLYDELARAGLGPGLVLATPAGRDLLALLDEQLARRARGRVPDLDPDPAWTVAEPGRDPARLRVAESLLTLGDGGFGTRGALEEQPPGATPLVLASGVYTGDGPGQHLLPGPVWTGLALPGGRGRERRRLDLRCGLLLREELTDGGLRTLRFASAARRGLMVLRAEGRPSRLRAGPPLVAAPDGPPVEGRRDGRRWARSVSTVRGGIAALADDRVVTTRGLRTVERMAGYVADPDRAPTPHQAAAVLDAARAAGFERLLAEHRRAWAARWRDADVEIPDDPQAQLALRFALFQLWGNVADSAEAAVGARGLSGGGYSGHVFWDADVFVLPAVAAVSPRAARAMLGYRVRRLSRARAAAAARGLAGARFPWESALDGDDVTPRSADVEGRTVPILTGELEEHVVSDVAWAAHHYAEWCGDGSFLAGAGAPLLLDTARYWASRCTVDADGRAHVNGVIGPDEYHVAVDDNAYTNILVRWHLRRAADLLDAGGSGSEESPRWRRIADGLVDGYDPVRGCHEQFAGFFDLEPLTVADLGVRPPVAADLLLGAARTARAQVIKQPDVLMAHHLVPDDLPPGSLARDLDFYGPRTAHGSSLSPAVSASLLARAGRPDEALVLLRVALRLDLDDLTGMTAAGLHLATLGGVWQAVLFGFAGLRVRAGALQADPRLPAAWGRLRLRFRCLGTRVVLDVRPDRFALRPERPLRVGRSGRRVPGGAEAVFVRTDTGWTEVEP